MDGGIERSVGWAAATGALVEIAWALAVFPRWRASHEANGWVFGIPLAVV